MPELPEVQTVVSELNNLLIGKQIKNIFEYRKNTIYNEASSIVGLEIKKIERRGKFIVISLNKDLKMLIHLRMTGKIIYPYNVKKGKHLRAKFTFKDGSEMGFDDIRTFGKIEIIYKDKINKKFKNLGVEPLNKEFSFDYLKNKLSKRTVSIKSFLLDQKMIAGLGNIYACEILYATKINPQKKCNELNEKQINDIVKITRNILKKAIKCNGTTISDYRRIDEKTGEFQKFLKVYQKKECPKKHEISRIKQNGRTTFFCEKCQK